MTPSQRSSLEFLVDADDREFEMAALRACLKERDEALALARRVHAEYGPEICAGDGEEMWLCTRCAAIAHDIAMIPHKPDCLWLAAEACLKKAGQL